MFWPRGVLAYLGGFLTCSNTLILIRKNIDLGCFLWPRGVSAGLGGFLTCSNSEIFIRTSLSLDCFCGLEAPQPVWTGSLSAQMHNFLYDFGGGCGLEASQPVWEGSLSAQMHLFE